MKAGEVVHIRVSPQDLMTAIDLVRASGIVMQGLSLAQIVRLAMSGMFHKAREIGAVPTREGYEYNAMVEPFRVGEHRKDNVHMRHRVLVSQRIDALDAANIAHDLPPFAAQVVPTRSVVTPSLQSAAMQPAEYKRKQLRMRELRARRTNDPLNFTDTDQQEFDKLFDEGVRV